MNINHFATRRVNLILLVCFISCTAMAQKVYPDTISIDQLNMYKDKAVTMRNAGIIMTLVGVSLSVASILIEEYGSYHAFVYYSMLLGMATTIVGVPLWTVGGSRLDKAKFLYFDELDLHKAIKLKNAGRIVTLCGIGVAITGSIIAYGDSSIGVLVVSCGLGIATTLVGVPLWAVGISRMAKAELSLKRYNLAPEGSMALGLGITIRF